MITRRSALLGLAALAAPAIIRTPGLLMPVKVLRAEPWVIIRHSCLILNRDIENGLEISVYYDGRQWHQAAAGEAFESYDGMNWVPV